MKYHHNATFHLSEEEQIIKIYQAGYNMRDMARIYNCMPGTISKILERHNILTREEQHKISSVSRDKEIVSMYQSGLTSFEISNILGYSETLVYHVLIRKNIQRRSIRTRFFNEHAFDNLDDEHTAYWAGFLYADSSINKNQLVIGLSIRDLKHLIKFADFMGGNLEIKSNHNGCKLSLFSHHLTAKLQNLGIISRRGKFNPSLIPTEMERHFIRGYLDGDGCISNREKVIFLGQADILHWIKNHLVKNAQASDKVIPYQRQGILEIAWGGNYQFARIVDYIYKDATIYLERKKEIADKTKRG